MGYINFNEFNEYITTWFIQTMHCVSYVIATTKTIYEWQITKLLNFARTTSNNIPVKNFKNRLLDFSCNKEQNGRKK